MVVGWWVWCGGGRVVGGGCRVVVVCLDGVVVVWRPLGHRISFPAFTQLG